MKRINFNIKDRKTLSLVLCLVLVSVFTLTIAYAALNAVLTIQGSAQVTSADWDIHLANPKVTTGSATTTAPTIKTSSTMEFSTTLNMPGDFYEFTVDVVNSGSIDAMIENVIKNPELTTEQAKFLNYEVTYQNGESITTNQTLTHGTTMPIKVRVEYRRDISASDLPTTQTKLDLSLTLEYIQSDGTGTNVTNNGKITPVANGDINTVGTEICIDKECFYIISTSETEVTMLAKYNLYVGGKNINDNITEYGSIATGMQYPNMLGWISDSKPQEGVTPYSNPTTKGDSFSSYNGSIVEGYVNNYKSILENYGIEIIEARLIEYTELINPNTFACNSGTCSTNYPWIYSSTYWTGTPSGTDEIYRISSINLLSKVGYYYTMGVRPVIVISKDYFN